MSRFTCLYNFNIEVTSNIVHGEHPLAASNRRRVAASVRDERNYRHVPRALDSFSELTLMRRADSADSPGENLSALGDKMPQKFPILKVYVRNFFRAELAYSLAPNAKPSLTCHIFSAFLLQ